MHVGMTTFFQNLGRPIDDHAVYRHEISMADLAEPLGFDSIWGETARASVGRQYDLIAVPGTHEAEGALALVQSAEARAKIALNATIIQLMPISSGVGVD